MAKAKVLAFCGSLRKASYNRKLVLHACEILRGIDCDVEFIELKSLDLPLYDGDFEQASGMPAGAAKLAQAMIDADGAVIGNPEYNAGTTAVLKNTIDWMSRNKTSPFTGKPILLVGTSPGWFGAMKSHLMTRHILTALRSVVVPTQITIPLADKNFGPDGLLTDTAHVNLLKSGCEELLKFAKALRP